MRHTRLLTSLLVLAIGATLCTGDPMMIKLPSSDLAAKANPYTLTLEFSDPALAGKGAVGVLEKRFGYES